MRSRSKDNISCFQILKNRFIRILWGSSRVIRINENQKVKYPGKRVLHVRITKKEFMSFELFLQAIESALHAGMQQL